MDIYDTKSIRRGTCPACGSLPAYTLPTLTPWFCSNAECAVIAWDPHKTLDELLADVEHIDLGPAAGGEPAAGERPA